MGIVHWHLKWHFSLPYQNPNSISMHSIRNSTPVVSRPKCSLVRSTVTTDHLAQLVFLSELSAQGLEVGDKSLARVENCFLGSDFAFGLDTELKSGKERVGNYIKPLSA